jgi:hypothetical protein
MMMVAVRFVTFPVGGHTSAPQTPFGFISQTRSVAHVFSNFIQPQDPSYKHFHPIFGFVGPIPRSYLEQGKIFIYSNIP